MMTYCSNPSNGTGGGGGGNPGGGASPSPQIPCSSANAGTPPVASPGNGGGGTGGGDEDDVWRGHSIAALRRRASELNAAIPSYLQINYDAATHNNASVY